MMAYRGDTGESYRDNGLLPSYSFPCNGTQDLTNPKGMVIYDMSSLAWTTVVKLENQKYLVPQVLDEIIGGR